ncbi:hypothetical protein NHX12_028912 [Muraenolepis orangiensis]|uniref:Uncharacterized protein n=1 Tax=Muraenolepis orangiensis TaxID=630683 RepID=A0A9Q0EE78_9TELE|nr:hypothetical protein NHX12_028912 [Muraenolepis orangiensis]
MACDGDLVDEKWACSDEGPFLTRPVNRGYWLTVVGGARPGPRRDAALNLGPDNGRLALLGFHSPTESEVHIATATAARGPAPVACYPHRPSTPGYVVFNVTTMP